MGSDNKHIFPNGAAEVPVPQQNSYLDAWVIMDVSVHFNIF